MSQPSTRDTTAAELRSPDLRRRVEALIRISEHGEEPLDGAVVDALVENLAAPSKEVARYAAGAIAAAGTRSPAIVARLSALLEDPQAAARWTAAYALSLIDGALDMRACPPLLDALSNPDGDVRWAALELVVRLGRIDQAAVRDRLLALQSDPDANARKMSLYALRDLGIRDPAVIAAARAACAGADVHVRLAALSLLKQAGPHARAAAGAVAACLSSDPDQGVRRAAAFTLGYLDDHSEPVIAALHEAANDQHDDSLGKSARQTLTRLKEER
jgi:HEAT repeat protein